MKLVQASYYASNIEKEIICQRVYALIAKGQVFVDLESLCNWSLPNPDLKAQLWAELTDPLNSDSQSTYIWKIDAFAQMECQLELMEKYFNLFY